jgi:hypothetical protein
MPERADPAAPRARAVAVQLDAYPRLCGLPVTIERLVTASIGAGDVPTLAWPPRSKRLVAFIVAAAVLTVAVTLLAGTTAAGA